MNEDRQRGSDFCSRMVSEPNVFLESFSYPDNSQASDTVSVDSSDSLETSFSACSPDNISRLETNRWKVPLESVDRESMNCKMRSYIFRRGFAEDVQKKIFWRERERGSVFEEAVIGCICVTSETNISALYWDFLTVAYSAHHQIQLQARFVIFKEGLFAIREVPPRGVTRLCFYHLDFFY